MQDFEIEMQYKRRMINFLEYAQMRYSYCQHSDCSTEELTAFLSMVGIVALLEEARRLKNGKMQFCNHLITK